MPASNPLGPEPSRLGRGWSRRWRIGLIGVVGLIALPLAACGGTTGPGSASSTSPPATGSPSTSENSSTAPSSPSSSSSPGGCASTSTWVVSEQSIDAAISPGSIDSIRVGQHPCYDRVVLSLSSTSAVGVVARYVTVVHADPSDRPLPVTGGAVIQLTVQAGSVSTRAVAVGRIPPAVGDYVYSHRALPGWQALRAIRLAGNFEAVSTYAVGVRAKVPFRVLTYIDAQTHRRLVIVDIAHE